MAVLIAVLAFLNTGCKALFPADDRRTQNAWRSFEEVETKFDTIIPHKTTVEDLKSMGLDPYTTPNLKMLTYLDIIQHFMPNQSITLADLQEDVRLCIESKDSCQAYEVNLEDVHAKRFGNLALDAFGFKKKTRTTGWNFKGLLIIKDGVVTYKLRSGEPYVDRLEKKTKPLGPFQELDSFLGRLPGAF